MNKLILIAAMDKNRTIAIEGEGIPWNYPEDMKQYKQTIKDQHLLCGRKTFESILKPLDKTSIVLTRDEQYTTKYDNVKIANSKEEAHDIMEELQGDVYNIGGAEIYDLFIDDADELILTEIPETYTAEDSTKYRKFPKINKENWEITKTEDFENFTVKTYSRC